MRFEVNYNLDDIQSWIKCSHEHGEKIWARSGLYSAVCNIFASEIRERPHNFENLYDCASSKVSEVAIRLKINKENTYDNFFKDNEHFFRYILRSMRGLYLNDKNKAFKPSNQAVVAEIDGTVSFGPDSRGMTKVIIRPETGGPKEYLIPKGRHIIVQEGDFVKAGEMISYGCLDINDETDIESQPDSLGDDWLIIYDVNVIEKKAGDLLAAFGKWFANTKVTKLKNHFQCIMSIDDQHKHIIVYGFLERGENSDVIRKQFQRILNENTYKGNNRRIRKFWKDFLETDQGRKLHQKLLKGV